MVCVKFGLWTLIHFTKAEKITLFTFGCPNDDKFSRLPGLFWCLVWLHFFVQHMIAGITALWFFTVLCATKACSSCV